MAPLTTHGLSTTKSEHKAAPEPSNPPFRFNPKAAIFVPTRTAAPPADPLSLLFTPAYSFSPGCVAVFCGAPYELQESGLWVRLPVLTGNHAQGSHVPPPGQLAGTLPFCTSPWIPPSGYQPSLLARPAM